MLTCIDSTSRRDHIHGSTGGVYHTDISGHCGEIAGVDLLLSTNTT